MRLYDERHGRPARGGPVGRLLRYFPLLLGAAVSAFLLVVAVSEHADRDNSLRVQHDGLRATGVVEQVTVTTHHGRGTTYTTRLLVGLPGTVGDTRETVTHVPFRDDATPGQQVTVVLDRADPAYSELPGHPTTDASDWIVPAVFGVLFAAFTVLFVLGALRVRRRGAG